MLLFPKLSPRQPVLECVQGAPPQASRSPACRPTGEPGPAVPRDLAGAASVRRKPNIQQLLSYKQDRGGGGTLLGLSVFPLGPEPCKVPPTIVPLLGSHFLSDLTEQLLREKPLKMAAGPQNLPGLVNVYGVEAPVGHFL